MRGTNAQAVRRAVVAKLDAAVSFPVSYSAPVDARQLVDPAGYHEAGWTAYGDISYDLPVFGGGVLHIDETCRVEVVVQVMRFDGTEQDAVDERAEQMLREVLTVVAADPDVEIADVSGVVVFDVRPIRTSADSGVIGDNPAHRAARFTVTFEAHSRLELA